MKKGRFDGTNCWTIKEDRFILQNYGVIPLEELLKQLGGRSRTAVMIRAHNLGVTQKYRIRREWKMSELAYLEKHYSSVSSKEIAEVLGRSPSCINAKARTLGLQKHRKERHTLLLDYIKNSPRHSCGILIQIAAIDLQNVFGGVREPVRHLKLFYKLEKGYYHFFLDSKGELLESTNIIK